MKEDKAPPMAPLGPNDVIPVAAGGDGVVEKPYEYQAWPAWRYDPETGKGEIFESAEEVPEGWTDVPPGTTPAGEEPVVVDTSLLENGAGAGGGSGAADDTDDDDDDDDDGESGAGEDAGTPLDKDGLVALGQAKLAEILTAKNDALKADGKEEIEFLPNWPKVKLADAILANGGHSVPKED